MAHPLIDLARAAIRQRLTSGDALDLPAGEPIPSPAGLFVSLHDPPDRSGRSGRLRGCLGTFAPEGPSLQADVARQAVLSALTDPRCESVRLDEVDRIAITIYLLDRPEPVDRLEDLDPARYGVIVASGSRRGVLLPGLAGIETAAEQVSIARRKAGIADDAPVELSRFAAQIFE